MASIGILLGRAKAFCEGRTAAGKGYNRAKINSQIDTINDTDHCVNCHYPKIHTPRILNHHLYKWTVYNVDKVE